MLKVVICQNIIPDYRVPVFNLLAQSVDLTVAYDTDCKLSPDIRFKTMRVTSKKIPKTGMFYYGRSFRTFMKTQDVIIQMLVPNCVDFSFFRFWNRHSKRISWGIGVPASYNTRFDDPAVDTRRLVKLIKKSDAALFYSDLPVLKYSHSGINKEKLFVAHNTVEVMDTDISEEKDSILFVGSLYRQKRVDILLQSYARVHKSNPHIPKLVIVGDGDERENILRFIEEKGLSHKVELTGGIYDEAVLAPYFKRALFCVSPDQAGLSVLKSMGYGVPYVTHKNAITGGEIFNIITGKTGILMFSFDELDKLIWLAGNKPERYIEMGKNAHKHYRENRTVENMVQGFLDAIFYVTKERDCSDGK